MSIERTNHNNLILPTNESSGIPRRLAKKLAKPDRRKRVFVMLYDGLTLVFRPGDRHYIEPGRVLEKTIGL